MRATDEKPVNAQQASALLGIGQSYISAVKRALGIRGRYFFPSQIRAFIRNNPSFTVSQIYPLKTAKPITMLQHCPAMRDLIPSMPSSPGSATIKPSQTAGTASGLRELEAESAPLTTRKQLPPTRSTEWRNHLFGQRFTELFGTWPNAKVTCSRETFRRFGLGDPATFKMIKRSAKEAGIADGDWADLLALWLAAVIGDDAELLRIEKADDGIQGVKGNDASPLAKLFVELSQKEQEVILRLLQRSDVIACLPGLLELGITRSVSRKPAGRRRSRVEKPTLERIAEPKPSTLGQPHDHTPSVVEATSAPDNGKPCPPRRRLTLAERRPANPWSEL